MSEQKPQQFRPPLYHRSPNESALKSKRPDAGEARANDKQSWEAYRKWLTRVGAQPAAERTPFDHSIYSWKGYQNWADKVREAWKVEE
jgi:hypothetical protein